MKRKRKTIGSKKPAARAPKRAVAREPKAARKPALSPAAKIAHDLLVAATRDVDFVYPAVPTRLVIEPDGFHVQLDIFDRDTGTPVTIDLRDDLPTFLISREHALDWIYARVRDAWVHELNEALFVDGTRRRELHNARGQTIPPPDEAARSELDAFKVQLATFLSETAPVTGGPRSNLDTFKDQLAAFLMLGTPRRSNF